MACSGLLWFVVARRLRHGQVRYGWARHGEAVGVRSGLVGLDELEQGRAVEAYFVLAW